MPAKFREELGGVFYITRGLDNCLSVLSKSDWDSLGEKLRGLPSSQTKDIQRFLFSGAAELEPDKQGRVLIPQPLRDYAGLTKDVVIIGFFSFSSINVNPEACAISITAILPFLR